MGYHYGSYRSYPPGSSSGPYGGYRRDYYYDKSRYGFDGPDISLETYKKEVRSLFLITIIVPLILVAIATVLFSFLAPVIKTLLLNLGSFLSVKILTASVATLGAAVVLPIGYALYILRERNKPLYGSVEIGFGIFLTYYTISRLVGNAVSLTTTNTNQIVATLTALMSSVYIIVRGLDHIGQYRKKIMESMKLLEAVETDSIESARRLLYSGTNPNIANKSGDTPLLLAIRKENVELVKDLLAHGANVYSTNKTGEFAVSLAKRAKKPEIEALISKQSVDEA